ncbi:MAG TPA: DUF2163 domain-containing protein, partial [Pyrinomonadaceae bacterium]|nr:DUF2163 domain-containing protein [Pyrinomonadaceae bacterium]
MRTPRNYSAPYTSADLLNHMAQSVTTLAVCLKLTPTTGSAIGFTSTTRNLTLAAHPGVTFLAAPGLMPTTVEHNVSEVPDMECDLILTASGITEDDWLAGAWQAATAEVFTLNYAAPTMGELVDFSGKVHDGRLLGEMIKLELRGKSAVAQLNVCDVNSPTCRSKFGDPTPGQCTKDLTALTRTGQAVTSVTDRLTFRASATLAPTVSYNEGLITWTSGNNAGRSMEVKTFDNATKEFVLKQPMGKAIQTGDGFTVVEGCDKLIATCIAYANAINFVGEPYTPLPEKAFRIPATAQ